MAGGETAPIEKSILVVRGQRVILAADLAKIYGVETRVLNQAVKRNRERFPEDFTFRLTRDEATEIAASRSQSVILKRGENIKYLPYVFTEHGAIMAANVLNSPHAVRMSVYVVRAFIRLRHTVELQKDIMAKLEELERTATAHDTDIKRLFAAVRQLMAPPDAKKRKIGFLVGKKPPATAEPKHSSFRRFENSRNVEVPSRSRITNTITASIRLRPRHFSPPTNHENVFCFDKATRAQRRVHGKTEI
jgi:ORF6N domain